jgi:tetrahydromethanopterin S-methyltransferase subunit C
VKKLISIGVALALLALVVMPAAAAAYTEPQTYAKIPFAIVASGLQMLSEMWPDLSDALGMTSLDWVGGVLCQVGGWTYGPLAWSVDMMAWGMGLVGDILGALPTDLGLPDWLPTIVTSIVDALKACFTPTVCTNSTYPACP